MKRTTVAVLIIAVLLAVIAPSLSWFARLIDMDPVTVSGTTEAGSYFESGDGSEASPYIISQPVHLYNLAWLQYIGYFNLGPINNGRVQSCFKLKNDIDMEGLEIPPIGTTQYPFLGNFDGDGKLISNFTTGNARTLFSRMPSNARFEVDGLLSEYRGESTEVGAVIGFFGVIGNYRGVADAITESEGFDESLNEAKNTGIYNYTLVNSSNATLVGLVGGYVNARLQGMMINKCTITVEDGARSITDITASLSDHTLIGYATSAHANDITVYTPDLGSFEDINNVSGFKPGWGESISMDKLYETLSSSFADGGNATSITYRQTSIDGGAYEASRHEFVLHEPNDYFSAVYSTGHDRYNPYFCLAGGYMDTVITYDRENIEKKEGRYISYNGNYLTVTGTPGNYSVTNSTSEGAATVWVFDEVAGLIYTFVNNYTVYLNQNNENLSIDDMPTSSWAIGTNNNAITADGFYRLRYNSGVWKAGLAANKELAQFTGTYTPDPEDENPDDSNPFIIKKYTSILTEVMHYEDTTENRTNSTYIPLQMGTGYMPANDAEGVELYGHNSGYITGGLYSALKGQGTLDDTNHNGDVRVGRYSTQNISSNTQEPYVYTIDKSTGTFIQIPTDISSEIYNYSYLENLEKYEKAVVQYNEYFDTSENASGYLYGLHFMSGNIATDRITVPKAIINGEEYENYELPADCIDFTVQDTGFINFFAGTYYTANNCFFSLNRVERDSDGGIASVKEIVKIYDPSGKMRGGYIYEYSDGTYEKYQAGKFVPASAPSADISVAFDLSWITASDEVEGWIPNTHDPDNPPPPEDLRGYGYYFEIPVDAGEFALGSVNGDNKYGAYLLYLDIGSVPQEMPDLVNRVTVEEVITEDSALTADGVGIMDGNAYASSDSASISLKIPTGFGTSLEIERSENTVTLGGDSASVLLNSVDAPLTVVGKSFTKTSITTKRVTIIDDNQTQNTLIIAVLTFRDANANGVVDDGEVTILDADGNSLAEAVSLTSSGTVSSFTLSSKPSGDEIDWSDITEVSPPAIVLSTSDGTVPASVYDYDTKTYTLTSESPVTVKEFELTDGTVEHIVINGVEITDAHIGETIP